MSSSEILLVLLWKISPLHLAVHVKKKVTIGVIQIEEVMVAPDLTIVTDLKMGKDDKVLRGLEVEMKIVLVVVTVAKATTDPAGDTTIVLEEDMMIVAVTATDLEEDMMIAKVMVIVEDTATDLEEDTMIAAGDMMTVLAEVMTIAAGVTIVAGDTMIDLVEDMTIARVTIVARTAEVIVHLRRTAKDEVAAPSVKIGPRWLKEPPPLPVARRALLNLRHPKLPKTFPKKSPRRRANRNPHSILLEELDLGKRF